MSSFLDLVDAVGEYYGTGSDQWRTIAQGGINSPEALNIISQVPGVNVTTSNSGKILGYDVSTAFPNSTPASSVINSNTQTGAFNNSFSSNIPANATPPSTDLPNGGMTSGAKLSGVGSTVATVADKVSLAAVGVALGTKLGKLIDSGIYATNPNWFDTFYPSLNPETWDDLATTESGKNFIRAIFGLQNDSATMYVDERMLAYTYMMLLANGAYGSGGYDTDQSRVDPLLLQHPNTDYHIECGTYLDSMTIRGAYQWRRQYWAENCIIFAWAGADPNGRAIVYGVSDSVGTIEYKENDTEYPALLVNRPFTVGGETYYYNQVGLSLSDSTESTLYTFQRSYANGSFSLQDAYIIALLGTIETPAIDGIENNPQASTYINPDTLINPTTGATVTPNDNIDDVLLALQTQYPDLFNGSIYTQVPQPDGTISTITYIPVPYPNQSTTDQPISDTTPNVNPQTDPQVTPDNRPNSAQDIADSVTTPTNNAPNTGDGTTPTVVAPTGGASSLWAVYNPTQTQVDDFGAWLWSSNFVEQIKKMFSDPMQGIIGLHKIFATPSTGAAQNIKVGYLDSGVPSAVVTSQYTDIDCGAVNVAEYFGNVFDYEDTNIRLYLPFIGIVDLSTSDVMRGNVRVVYHVDVITGACLADVIVSRDSAGGVLYQYSGDAAVRYPVSSGSYMGMVNGVLAIAGAVIGVASGGAALPAVMGAVGGIMNSHTDVKHSGSFSGAAGAMGAKIPYLIIERPQTAMANDFISYQGIGDNRVVNVGSLAGYFKMTDVHTEGVINASEQEIEQIKALLEGGVIQ